MNAGVVSCQQEARRRAHHEGGPPPSTATPAATGLENPEGRLPAEEDDVAGRVLAAAFLQGVARAAQMAQQQQPVRYQHSYNTHRMFCMESV